MTRTKKHQHTESSAVDVGFAGIRRLPSLLGWSNLLVPGDFWVNCRNGCFTAELYCASGRCSHRPDAREHDAADGHSPRDLRRRYFFMEYLLTESIGNRRRPKGGKYSKRTCGAARRSDRRVGKKRPDFLLERGRVLPHNLGRVEHRSFDARPFVIPSADIIGHARHAGKANAHATRHRRF